MHVENSKPATTWWSFECGKGVNCTLSPSAWAALTAFSMVGALTGGVLAGLASDRIGRRRAIVLALACGVLTIPLWAFAPSVPLLFAGGFAMQFMVQGAWGVIPAHITELSPDSVRGSASVREHQTGSGCCHPTPSLPRGLHRAHGSSRSWVSGR